MIKLIILFSLLLLPYGCSGQTAKREEALKAQLQGALEQALSQAAANPGGTIEINLNEQPGIVQPGDLVEIGFEYTIEPGSDCPSGKKDRWPESFRRGRRSVVAGRASSFPGLEALLDMRSGEQKTIRLSADAAYGRRDPAKELTYPCRKPIPMQFLLPTAKTRQGCQEEPEEKRVIDLYPHIQAEVLDEDENKRTVRLLVGEGYRFEDPFGPTVVHIENGMAVFHLTPSVGALFRAANGAGLIVSADAESFTVDFNHPLAGCDLQLDLTLYTITKASDWQARIIDWQEDPEEAIALSAACGKPVVLVLYAGWCEWSKKLLNETLRDPMVLSLAERFIWAKVDSSEQAQYKQAYGQSTFPSIVILSPQNTAIERIEGFRSADAVHAVLERISMEGEDKL